MRQLTTVENEDQVCDGAFIGALLRREADVGSIIVVDAGQVCLLVH